MKFPKLKDGAEPKLAYYDTNRNRFIVITWNDTHVDVYQWTGSSDYEYIHAYQRHKIEK